MGIKGHDFLEQLRGFPPNTFERKFSHGAFRLGLGFILNADELDFLLMAAFLAALCNISFNGLGGCDGEIKLEREGHRRALEAKFMDARDKLRATAGWRQLSPPERAAIQRRFLTVTVTVTDGELA
jgi:hypothetical protein